MEKNFDEPELWTMFCQETLFEEKKVDATKSKRIIHLKEIYDDYSPKLRQFLSALFCAGETHVTFEAFLVNAHARFIDSPLYKEPSEGGLYSSVEEGEKI